MQFQCTARPRTQAEYLPLEACGLTAELIRRSGSGSLQDPTVYTARIQNPGSTDWEGVVHLELICSKVNPRFFLPGFMYGRNRGEAPLRVDNEFPRLREAPANRPASPWWMVRSDRLSHPAAFLYDDQHFYGLCASPYLIESDGMRRQWKPGLTGKFSQYMGFTCSLEHGSVGYTLGYENAPWLFIQSHRVLPRQEMGANCIRLAAGETLELELLVYDFAAQDERAFYPAVEAVYNLYHQAPRSGPAAPTAAADLAGAVAHDAWLEESKNYSGIVYEKPDGTLEYNPIFSISWTNGLSVAVPLLMAALRLQDEAIRTQALACIDNIAAHSLNPRSGLPFETWDAAAGWSSHGWWFDGMHTGGHSGYLAGQTTYYLLKAYHYEKTLHGTEHPEWLAFAKGVVEHLNAARNTDGEYAFILSDTTGAGLEYDALGSAWGLTAAAAYALLTGDHSALPELQRSEAHYYDAFVRRAECYGGPLDTDKTVDSEGVLAYIRAARLLHELTGEALYLDHLHDALCYEFSFKFCYNSPIQTPPLSKVGWSSCGGSITSVANPHIHPMSSTVIDELLYYTHCRKDSYMESRLQDTVGWSRQTYNTHDKEYDYGHRGWMSERFCHCEGLLVQKYPDDSPASTWFALMPWACGSILEGLCGENWNA